jgi:hypothetical protein
MMLPKWPMFAGALLILSGACRIAFAAPVTCIIAKTAPAPAELNSTGSTLEVTLTNKCEKDITSYRIRFLDDSGKEVRGFGQELLASLVSSVPGADIFRVNSSRVVHLDGSGPSSMVLSAVIFLDGSTAGDPDQVALLVRTRASVLKGYREELEVLRTYSQWSATLDLHRKLDEARQAKDPAAQYLERLAHQFDRSDAASWEAYVSGQVAWMTRAAALFERSLGTSVGANK